MIEQQEEFGLKLLKKDWSSKEARRQALGSWLGNPLKGLFPFCSHSSPTIPFNTLNLPGTRGAGKAPCSLLPQKAEDTCCAHCFALTAQWVNGKQWSCSLCAAHLASWRELHFHFRISIWNQKDVSLLHLLKQGTTFSWPEIHAKLLTDIFTPVRMAAIQKSTSNKCWRGCGEKGTLFHCWWECKLV